MCGGGNSAAKAAAVQEKERQAQIASTTSRVNQVFDAPERQQQYGDFIGNLRSLYGDTLNRQKADTDRGTKFALARSGQTGGSVAVDTRKDVGEEYSRGLIEAERNAQSALAGLQTQDEQSRTDLIRLAQTGVDTGTTASRAEAATRVNLGNASAAAIPQGLMDVFSNTSAVLKSQQDAADKRRAMRAPVGGLY